MTGISSDSFDEESLVQASAESWERHWANLLHRSPERQRKGLMAKLEGFIKRSGCAQLICDIVSNELGANPGKKILEAGCGTGHVSIHLAQNGSSPFLLDTSSSALEYARKQAESQGFNAALLRASILALPFKDGAFDGCFNVGVVDHFGPRRRADAVEEMMRVTRGESPVVVVVNDSRSLIHPIAVRYAQKKGTWPHGFKAAIRSIEPIVSEGKDDLLIKEYSTGFVCQFEFLHYLLPQKRLIKSLFFRIFYIVSVPFKFLNRLPGQYLVTVIRRKTSPDV
jgi:ubiquinone/menaquinone biosynthesis C-methylase UbiE